MELREHHSQFDGDAADAPLAYQLIFKCPGDGIGLQVAALPGVGFFKSSGWAKLG